MHARERKRQMQIALWNTRIFVDISFVNDNLTNININHIIMTATNQIYRVNAWLKMAKQSRIYTKHKIEG